MESKLKLFSLGIVVKDKEPDSWDIEAFPIEVLPNTSGELVEPEEIQVETKDANDSNINITIKKSSTVTAQWLSFGSYNRASAPDVCRGETVILFRFAGEDRFFWINMYSEIDLRKRESVMHFYSNKEKVVESADDLKKKGYYTLMDTRNKKIMLHTDDSDGEASQFDILIDTKEGIITLADAEENGIIFNGPDKTYTLNMKDSVLINGEKVIKHTTKEEYQVESEKNYKVTSKDMVNVTSKDKMELNFKGVKISCGTYELITVLEELLDAILAEKHIGNMGSPTQLDPGSMAKYQMIKQKITKFKG